jgi:hypothetical protein
VEHFSGQSLLPSFEELLAVARILTRRHGTTQAYNSALNASAPPENRPPKGSDWIRQSQSEDEAMDENHDEDELELPLPPEQPKDEIDTTVANSILFIRNAVWWREVCTAVAEGDSGRVWEIMKVSSIQDTRTQDTDHGPLTGLACHVRWQRKSILLSIPDGVVLQLQMGMERSLD